MPDEEVEAAFARATALDPKARWQSAAEFWQSLTIAVKVASERRHEAAARETPHGCASARPRRAREALLKYILRPAVAQERVPRGPDGLVRIGLKKAFPDGTVAVDLDPLSLLSRLCASVPPPRFHTVRYAGVLGSASKLRSRLAPKPAAAASAPSVEDIVNVPRRRPYRSWAELLRRTFGSDVLACRRCEGRLRLLAMVTEPKSVARYLTALGEPTEAPARAPARGPPFWKSRVLRRAASDDAAE